MRELRGADQAPGAVHEVQEFEEAAVVTRPAVVEAARIEPDGCILGTSGQRGAGDRRTGIEPPMGLELEARIRAPAP